MIVKVPENNFYIHHKHYLAYYKKKIHWREILASCFIGNALMFHTACLQEQEGGLTFELQVLHGAFRQRMEGVSREVSRRIKHMRLPLLQDMLQQLVQDVPCRRAKVRG